MNKHGASAGLCCLAVVSALACSRVTDDNGSAGGDTSDWRVDLDSGGHRPGSGILGTAKTDGSATDSRSDQPEPQTDGAPREPEPDVADGGEWRASTEGGTKSDASSTSASSGADAAPLDGNDAGVTEGPACALPATFRWTGGRPLAEPKNGSVAMKDFTHVFHAGQHIVYFTTFASSWGSAMMTFKDWPDAAAAPQVKTGFGVAPTLFYFRPKEVWVLAYQWGPHKFSYRTSVDPSNTNSWSGEKSLYDTALPASGTGPIDQTVICDGSRCYLFYAGDNGHIYKSSLPIDSFPGEFPAAKDSGIVGTAQNLFEAVQVYKLKGLPKFLMIVEAQGGSRYFRAWTAASLEGPWDLLTDAFAIDKNVVLTPNWTNDISHGDLVRSAPDETFTVDPCNLQLVFQGRDPSANADYSKLPYRLGLLTLQR